MTFWLDWIAAFLIVIGILIIAAGVQQWWEWRKEDRR